MEKIVCISIIVFNILSLLVLLILDVSLFGYIIEKVPLSKIEQNVYKAEKSLR